MSIEFDGQAAGYPTNRNVQPFDEAPPKDEIGKETYLPPKPYPPTPAGVT